MYRNRTGHLFGNTAGGGANNPFGGTVFELSPPKIAGGAWKETLLHSFGDRGSNGYWIDGYNPSGDLIGDSAGNLYGVTTEGGTAFPWDGVVFELVKSGATFNYQLLFSSFTCEYWGCCGLLRDASGNLYGTAPGGPNGAEGWGSIFELAGGSTYIDLFDFPAPSGCGGPCSADGASPVGPLVMDSSGNLYGVTTLGGANYGVVYMLTP